MVRLLDALTRRKVKPTILTRCCWPHCICGSKNDCGMSRYWNEVDRYHRDASRWVYLVIGAAVVMLVAIAMLT